VTSPDYLKTDPSRGASFPTEEASAEKKVRQSSVDFAQHTTTGSEISSSTTSPKARMKPIYGVK